MGSYAAPYCFFKGNFLRQKQLGLTSFSPSFKSVRSSGSLRLICCGILFGCLFLSLNYSAAQTIVLKKDKSASSKTKQTQQKKVSKSNPPKKKKQAKASESTEDSLTKALGTVQEIRIVGQRKIEKDAILNRITSKVGQSVSAERIREDVQNLFKAGYFNDIVVSTLGTPDKLILEFKVTEKPSITEIKFEGTQELKAEEVQEAAGIKAYEILSLSKLREANEKIQKFYEDKGFFLAKVEYKVEDIKKDETVKVTFKVQENEKVKVKKITILGSSKLSEASIKARLSTAEEGYFSGISSSGAYKQEIFDRDMQVIRFFYFNQGYVQAKIDRPWVTVTPDKKGIYITIRIEEGEQFEVGEIDFAGDVLFTREDLFQAIKIDENKIFAYDVLQRDLADLQAKFGDLGYAYANVIPRTRFHDKERKVDLVFEFDKGNKVYFGQINVVGNTKTRDKVVRRELKVQEGELYNETRRRQSLENIQRLGFFDDVNFKTSTPPDHPEVMNVDIVIKERNTGQIQLGAGYGTSSGFTLQGSVQQTNFLGKGQNLGVSLQLSNDYNQYDLTFTEPYFRDSLWSLGFRLFQTQTRGRADYDENETGASLFSGHPLGDYLRFNVSYTYTADRLASKTFTDASGKEISTDQDLFPLSTAEGDASMLGTSIEYDTRNDRFKTSKGIYLRGSYANAGLVGGNLNYQRSGADFRFFRNIFWDVVWRNSFSYANISSTRNDREVPFNKLYLLGGPYSLRGYHFARVGKMKKSKALEALHPDLPEEYTRFYGGTQQIIYQGELLFPLVREAEMYGVAFYDVGQAEDNFTADNFYSDAGIGIRWFSPIGPLRFELGFPFKRTSFYHDASVFEFSIGTPF